MASTSGPSLFEARILIVDDERANVVLLERTLSAAGYANVRGTIDSLQAIPLVAEYQPDLILLDLLMPHHDGFAVMEQLRNERPEDADIPILVLTADPAPETKRRALAEGAKDFLTKPFELIEVLARIENLLEIRFLRLQLETQDEAMRLLRELSAHATSIDGPKAASG